MATTYEIRTNPQFNSLEIFFSGKPSAEVRTALKSLKFRWHSVKKCWYGYGMEETVASAIISADNGTEETTVYGDGYMGGGSVYGSKSNKCLYGADLSKAIRADLKAAGVKGVTVSCHSYAGGQNITAKVKMDSSSFIPQEDFISQHEVQPRWDWIWTGEENISVDKYFSLDAAEQERIRLLSANAEYEKYTQHNNNLNQFHIDDFYPVYTEATKAKLHRVLDIILAYRYDNSNSMVDYFDTNFYYDIKSIVA